jgi:hypothetical protein
MPILDAEGRPIQSGSANKIYSRDDVREICEMCVRQICNFCGIEEAQALNTEGAEALALDLLKEGLSVEQARRRLEEIATRVDQQDRKPRRRVGGARG